MIKTISYWKHCRLVLLIMVFSSVLYVLSQSFLDRSVKKDAVAPFELPSAVPLEGWKSLTSYLSSSQIPEPSSFLYGRSYRYRAANTTLNIEMRYLTDTSGDVRELIKEYTPISESIEQLQVVQRQKEDIGFYILFVYQKRAYLSACVNSRGNATVSAAQFKQNQNNYASWSANVVPWLLGEGSLKDERCLWAHLSIPLEEEASTEQTYQTLEETWFPWFRWWQSHLTQL